MHFAAGTVRASAGRLPRATPTVGRPRTTVRATARRRCNGRRRRGLGTAPGRVAARACPLASPAVVPRRCATKPSASPPLPASKSNHDPRLAPAVHTASEPRDRNLTRPGRREVGSAPTSSRARRSTQGASWRTRSAGATRRAMRSSASRCAPVGGPPFWASSSMSARKRACHGDSGAGLSRHRRISAAMVCAGGRSTVRVIAAPPPLDASVASIRRASGPQPPARSPRCRRHRPAPHVFGSHPASDGGSAGCGSGRIVARRRLCPSV